MKTTYINNENKNLVVPAVKPIRVRSGWRQATMAHKNVKGYSRKNFKIDQD